MVKESSRDIAKKDKSELDILNDKVVVVNTGLKAIVRNFYNVGKALSDIKQGDLFKSKGYKNFIEFTKSEFNLSRDQSYRLVNIYNKFPNSQYKDFSFSQLTEMLTLPTDKLNDVSPDMTVKEIRNIKKSDKKDEDKVIKKKDKIEFGDQLNVIDVVATDEKQEFVKVVDEIAGLEASNNILKKRYEALGVKFENLKNVSKIKDEQINELKARLELAKSSMDNTIKRDNEIIKNLKNENANLLSQIADFQKIKNDNDKLKKENDRLKKEKDKSKDKPKDLPS